MLKKTLTLLTCAVVLAGCQSTPALPEPAESSALDELVLLSVEARQELRLLAKAQEALSQEAMTSRQHEERFIQATHIPEGFDRLADFDLVLPAREAAKAIATAAGYEIAFYGSPTVNEPFVRIHQRQKPLAEALRELGLQTGSSILVEVHPAAKLMRFVYQS